MQLIRMNNKRDIHGLLENMRVLLRTKTVSIMMSINILLIIDIAFIINLSLKLMTSTSEIYNDHPYGSTNVKSSLLKKKIDHYSYLLSDHIGKGYSSIVYRGKDDLNGNTVAIKVIDRKHLKGDVHKKLLSNQIQALSTLSHPNIIHLYNQYQIGNQVSIVTQFCAGGDLSKKIKKMQEFGFRKGMPQKEAIAIFKQIISGYQSLQYHGWIHRDLKPANIFITDTGNIKIADFGFVVQGSDHRKTFNYNVGSPVYMPYEALTDSKYSYKSDIWALGIIFFELLAGKTPWRAKNQSDLKKLIKNNPISTLIPAEISSESKAFLLNSLQFDHGARMGPEDLGTYFKEDRPIGERMFSRKVSEQLDANIRNKKYNLYQMASLERDYTKYTAARTNRNMVKNELQGYRRVGMRTTDKRFATFQKNNTSKHRTATTTISEIDLVKNECSDNRKTQNTFTGLNEEQMHQLSFKRRKQIQKQLISQLHLCRFMYKLIMRILQNNRMQNKMMKISEEIIIGMREFIFTKFGQIIKMQSNDSEYGLRIKNDVERQCFMKKQQYFNLVSLIQEYQCKYRAQFKKQNIQNQQQRNELNLIQILQQQIISLYTQIQNILVIDSQLQQIIIILDYLITLRQIMLIIKKSKGDTTQFHAKSKIQSIVQGKPSKIITSAHIQAIGKKLKTIQLVKNF